MEKGRMSGDLISREAVLEALRARGRKLQNLSVTSFEKAISLGVAYECVGIVKDAPAVDAEPVRHGRWINEGVYVTTAYGSLDVYRCSACNSEITIDNYDSYCPNCGAKMDKEGEK